MPAVAAQHRVDAHGDGVTACTASNQNIDTLFRKTASSEPAKAASGWAKAESGWESGWAGPGRAGLDRDSTQEYTLCFNQENI
jgi:hypothetical protein